MSKFTYTVDLGILGEVDVKVEFDVSQYVAATMYDRNGDPGSPAEGGEVEITSVECAEYPSLSAAIAEYLQNDDSFLEAAYDAACDDRCDYEETRDEDY